MNAVLISRRKYMRSRTNPEGAPASVEDCIVTLAHDSYPYTGQEIMPQVAVTTADGVPLVVNVDYFVSYSDNVNVGAGTVTVTGTGEYVGAVVKTFQITSAQPEPTEWDFDIADAAFVKTADWSSISSEIRYVSISDNKEDAFAVTGSDKYLRHLKIPEYDPDNVESVSVSQEGKGYYRISSPDGIHAYASLEQGSVSSGELSFFQFNLGQPFDVDEIPKSSSAIRIAHMPGMYGRYTCFVFVSGDGMNAVTAEYYGTSISVYGYALQTPFDLTSASLLGSIAETASGSLPFRNISISGDGRYFVGVYFRPSGIWLRKYKLSTPYDFSTAELEGEKTVTEVKSSWGAGWIQIDPSGTYAICGDGSSNVSLLRLRPPAEAV